MTKLPEGGAVGTAQTRSYTYWFTVGVEICLVLWIQHDLEPGGSEFFRHALGVESSWLVWLLGFLGNSSTCGLAASTVSVTYTQFTGTTYVEDRIGYAKAGGRDIAYWTGLIGFLLWLAVFSFWVPLHFAGGLRPVLVLVAAIVTACIAARLIARAVFTALFGPPSFTLDRPRHR